MENKQLNKNEYQYKYKTPGGGLGFICGLFTILGLIGGFLYPVESEQREEFITGWKLGFAFVVVVSIVSIFITLTVNK